MGGMGGEGRPPQGAIERGGGRRRREEEEEERRRGGGEKEGMEGVSLLRGSSGVGGGWSVVLSSMVIILN